MSPCQSLPILVRHHHVWGCVVDLTWLSWSSCCLVDFSCRKDKNEPYYKPYYFPTSLYKLPSRKIVLILLLFSFWFSSIKSELYVQLIRKVFGWGINTYGKYPRKEDKDRREDEENCHNTFILRQAFGHEVEI